VDRECSELGPEVRGSTLDFKRDSDLDGRSKNSGFSSQLSSAVDNSG
jgi:hypothetical protein